MEDFELSAYIGKQIKSFREKKGWTTQDLADRLHTSRVTVTRYETGSRKANQDMLYKTSLLMIFFHHVTTRSKDLRPSSKPCLT